MAPQGRYWLLTIPQHMFVPYRPTGCSYIKGQLECGEEDGYVHWQLLVLFEKKCRLGRVKELFGNQVHAELSRSQAAEDYVWKEHTRVEGTQFELGRKPMQRAREKDWDEVWENAKRGKFEEIPGDIRVRCYNQLSRIAKDYLSPVALEKEVYVFWGRTGTGKSRRAWEEATFDAYPKDPNTKFWDGYRGQENVVIDEFRGKIDISNILRWFDRYPVSVETKGSGVVLSCRRIWVTSNVDPREWYADIDNETKDALMRRLRVTQFL